MLKWETHLRGVIEPTELPHAKCPGGAYVIGEDGGTYRGGQFQAGNPFRPIWVGDPRTTKTEAMQDCEAHHSQNDETALAAN